MKIFIFTKDFITSFGVLQSGDSWTLGACNFKNSPGHEDTYFTECSDNDARGSFLPLYSAKEVDRVIVQFLSQFRMTGKLSSA